MSLTIWKYPVPLESRFRIAMPDASEILSVAAHGDEIFLWARVDTERPTVRRPFALICTGQTGVDDVYTWGRFVGSVSLRGGGAVYHVFDMPFEIPAYADYNDE